MALSLVQAAKKSREMISAYAGRPLQSPLALADERAIFFESDSSA